MSAQILVNGVRANCHRIEYFPGVKSAEYTLLMGAGSGPRVKPRLEVVMDSLTADTFRSDLREGATYRVEVSDHDGWCGHAVECRGMVYLGSSGPNGYSGRKTLLFAIDGPPPLKKAK